LAVSFFYSKIRPTGKVKEILVSESQTSEQTETIQAGDQTFIIDGSSSEELWILDSPTIEQPNSDSFVFQITPPMQAFLIASFVCLPILLLPKFCVKIGFLAGSAGPWEDLLVGTFSLLLYLSSYRWNKTLLRTLVAVGFLFFLAWVTLLIHTDDRVCLNLEMSDSHAFGTLWRG
jgi:hypothetical protein